MKALVTETEYDDYLKNYIYSSPIRVYITSVIIYLLITTIINIIFDGPKETLDPHNLKLKLIGSFMWAALYTAMMLPVMKNTMKSSLRLNKILEQQPNEYESYVKCTYNKSKLLSKTGTLFIGKEALSFKKDSGFGKDITINYNSELDVSVEKSKANINHNIFFKNLPDTLTIIDKDKTYNFYMPCPDRIVEAIKGMKESN